MNSIIIIMVFGFASLGFCHEMMFGSCPVVEPMEGINMELMEGLWYVQESFDSREKCMTWNITKENEFNWFITESKQSGLLYATGLDSKTSTTGTLTPSDTDGKFSVKWPYNVFGSYDISFMYSDYENVAGVFSCQGMLFGQRQQAHLLSRVPNPQERYIQVTKGKLYNLKVELHYFKNVDHSMCHYSSESPEEVDVLFSDRFDFQNYNVEEDAPPPPKEMEIPL